MIKIEVLANNGIFFFSLPFVYVFVNKAINNIKPYFITRQNMIKIEVLASYKVILV